MKTPAAMRKLRAWGRRQLYSLFSSLGALAAHWGGTLLTLLVLGIAMALPLGLAVLMQNLHGLDLEQDSWGSISVFMSPAADEAGVRALAAESLERFGARAVVITPEQGMEEFLARSGFSEAAELFETSPLPFVLQVTPETTDADIDAAASRLADWFSAQATVESVQLDYKWLQRLAGLIALGDAFVRLLVILLSLAVVLVVANTIRLDVANRAREIGVLNMVGAPNGFIRQPFLYSGFWYGLLGAALALMLVFAGLAYLQPAVERLQDAYGNAFELQAPGIGACFAVLLAGGLLGLLGAAWSVQRYLHGFRVEDPPRPSSAGSSRKNLTD